MTNTSSMEPKCCGDNNSVTVQLKKGRSTCIICRPCCGFFLHGSAKATSIINSMMAVTAIVVFSVGVLDFFHFAHSVWDMTSNLKKILRSLFWSVYYLYWLFELFLSVFLYRATVKRNRKRCLAWLIIQVICYISWLSIFSFHIAYIGWYNATVEAWLWIYAIYKPYTFWVIKCFIDQQKYLGNFNGALAQLSDADLEYFEKGEQQHQHQNELGMSTTDPKNGPYDREFELPLKYLNDRSMWIQIGKGQFGTVFRAILRRRGDSPQDVAVKTLNSSAMEDICFKAMLTELKIMTFIGRHDNVVNLIGACTANIRERKLDIIVEFCPYGNLEAFLQTRRGLFKNQLDANGQCRKLGKKNRKRNNTYNYCWEPFYPQNVMMDTVTTTDLVTWSLQTAKGLEYLHGKKVIHGDIAARNVLLTLDKVAKISDFGLSKRICTYTRNYIRDLTPKLLPWRYLAPECLNMHTCYFSYESDLWSYGVTLFEYFSLGETPHSHWPEYSREFVMQIQNGRLLERPTYCPLNVYEIMERCWKVNPEMRSPFSQIIPRLESVLEEFRRNSPSPINTLLAQIHQNNFVSAQSLLHPSHARAAYRNRTPAGPTVADVGRDRDPDLVTLSYSSAYSDEYATSQNSGYHSGGYVSFSEQKQSESSSYTNTLAGGIMVV